MKRFSLISLAAAAVGIPLTFAGDVLLQDTTPGSMQTGHINISGTSKSGTVIVNSTAPTGAFAAGDFRTSSDQGRGILGNASSPTGATYGGLFQSASSGGRGIAGFSTATDGTTYGGFFGNSSIKGRAVYGQATAATGETYGVYGKAVSPEGFAIFAEGNMSATGVISGNGSGLTNVTPNGVAGGSLTGTYPNPSLASGSVGFAHIQANSVSASSLQSSSVGPPKLSSNAGSLARVSGGHLIANSTGAVGMGPNVSTLNPVLPDGLSIYGVPFQLYTAADSLRIIDFAEGSNQRATLFLRSPTQQIIASMTTQGTAGAYRGTVDVRNNAGVTQAQLIVDTNGNGIVSGDTKNFRLPNPEDPKTDIWYASLEGPEAAVYLRGTATLKNGRAFIPFPDHFQMVAIADGMTVSLTPRSVDTYGLAVIDQSIEGITVAELQRGKGSFSFDWRVEAVRKGHENFRVFRPWDEYLGDQEDRQEQWKARLRTIEWKKARAAGSGNAK